MKTKNIVEYDCLCFKNTDKHLTPELLQEIFLDIAQKYADEFLQSFRKDAPVDYANRPEALIADFFGLYDEFAQWKQEIKDGYLLRILKYIGVYDGHSINRECFLTALRVICFIGRYCDERNGDSLSFKGGALNVPYDDVARLERYVRMVK